MLEVYFETKAETMTFCDRVVQYGLDVELNWKTNDTWGNRIKIRESRSMEEQLANTAEAMAYVFTKHKESSWVADIIKNVYYYKDKEEVHRISELAHSILSGDESGDVPIPVDIDLRKTLKNCFQKNIHTEEAVHFDSLVNFRLQPYKEELIEIIGMAIDEFKREEDYQSFVQSLREYVTKKKSKFQVVHVVQGRNFKFYKANGKPFSKMEIKMLIQQEPLYIVGLDEAELNITPLLAMAPERVVIYGDHPSEPKTLTVINVFQEKAVFEPFTRFPFPNYLRNH
ncbi:putative sporulation protein YtxC [Sediminibacillus halophilus]|uniref:Putative sporulation protein YtxC n=1 Tax=Sediminibacillus halophilus TaxID=482461 RepID=A0A1G9YAK4_9BACI|nr:putative sporulation protein YtxC [Sediminibacillus halophilus]SDN06082.1 putative sporulation protein YtxC [Sediminibacillus halophilus]